VITEKNIQSKISRHCPFKLAVTKRYRGIELYLFAMFFCAKPYNFHNLTTMKDNTEAESEFDQELLREEVLLFMWICFAILSLKLAVDFLV
jgi:hypothetical protein